MASKSRASSRRSQSGKNDSVLRHSALSGRYVMKPVKEGSVSNERIREAVRGASKKKP